MTKLSRSGRIADVQNDHPAFDLYKSWMIQGGFTRECRMEEFRERNHRFAKQIGNRRMKSLDFAYAQQICKSAQGIIALRRVCGYRIFRLPEDRGR